MKTRNTSAPKSVSAVNGGQPLPRLVGQCYVFMRENHEWHASEVAVISIEGERFTVARAIDVCEGLLAPRGSKKRKLKTWTCSRAELW
jgi:hypothetical protein